ncbi:MAG: ThiF family adenylyltransferase [Clostridium perfringens]|nr:ThiF family adenylyltransferase [Clostridium perfringens]MDU3020342.1 ThiF family adenylyltransferase [Clostridium perfringens]
MKYMIKNSINVFFEEKTLVLNDTINKKVYKIHNNNSEFQYVINSLIDGKCEIENNIDKVKFDAYIEILKSKGLLRDRYENKYKNTIYEKQIDFFSNFVSDPNEIPKILKNKKIVIIGIGGVGCIAIQHLISCGVKNLIFIDNDIVNESNLNRQYCYNKKQVGMSKIEAIKSYINDLDMNISAKFYKNFINSTEDLKNILASEENIDFILQCADRPSIKIKNYALKYAMETDIPISFIGIGVYDGFWGPLLDKKDEMIKFYKYNKEMLSKIRSLSDITTSSIGFTNSIVTSFFIKDVIMYLIGINKVSSKNKILQINFDTNSISEVLNIRKITL